jgi:hypothetical protein
VAFRKERPTLVQRAGFADANDPETEHKSAASQLGLFIAPTVAKVMSQYISQLTELHKNGRLEAVQCARKTSDGRSVIDRGLYPDGSDILLAGGSSTLQYSCSSGFNWVRRPFVWWIWLCFQHVAHRKRKWTNKMQILPSVLILCAVFPDTLHELSCGSLLATIPERTLTHEIQRAAATWLAGNQVIATEAGFGSGSRTWLYTQTGAKITQGREDVAAFDAAGTGPAVVLGGGNQPFIAIEDTLHLLLDKHMPVLLKHHPAQVLPAPWCILAELFVLAWCCFLRSIPQICALCRFPMHNAEFWIHLLVY